MSTIALLAAAALPLCNDDSGGGYGWEEDGSFEDGEFEDAINVPGAIDVPDKIESQDDAFRTIRAIADHAKATGAGLSDANEKFRNLDDALADIRAAMRKLNEREMPAPAGASDKELLARYVEGKGDDSKVRLMDDYSDEPKWFTPGFLDDNPVTDLQRDIQLWSERRTLVRYFQRMGGRRQHTPRCDSNILGLARGLPKQIGDAIKRAFADTSGAGAEWIHDQMLPMIERELQYQYSVAGLFDEVPVNAETVLLPYLSAGFTPYLLGEVSGDDPAQVPSSTATTAQRSFSVKTFGARAQISENASEDAILSVVDAIIRPELIRALGIGEEDAIINGDTGTHQDTGLGSWNPDNIFPSAPGGGSNDHRRAFVGLRARAADVSNTTDRSTFSSATLRADLATVKGPKQGPGSNVIIASGVSLIALMGLAEVVTIDKFGPQASIKTGEVARVYGRSVVESQMLTEDLNASGIYDGVTTTKTGLLQVSTGRFKRFSRRGIRLRAQPDITRGITHMVVDRRSTFGTIDSASTKNVHLAYNMA